MEGFYGKEDGARKLLTKELFQARSLFLRGKSRLSYHVDYIMFLWGMERGPLEITSAALIRKFPTV